MKKPITPEMFQKFLAVLPIATVNVAIIKDDKVLLVKRLNEPAKGYWYTPGGIILKGESLEDSVLRVCKEETGLNVESIKLIGVYTEHWREGYFTKNIQTVTACYLAQPLSGNIKRDWQSSDIQWFPIDELPAETGETVKKMIDQYMLRDIVQLHLRDD